MDLLLTRELQLLDPAFRRDAAALRLLLAGEFREIGSSGRLYSKDEVIAALAHAPDRPMTLSHFAAQPLSETMTLVTYQVIDQSTHARSWHSSLWTLRDDRWQLLFHQGTRIVET